MLLEVRGLIKRFSGLVAVADVSFAIGPGEIVGVIGPNGSGKTTLLSMMAGLLAPTAGSVLWKGREIQRLRTDIIAAHGVVKTFQNPQVFAELSVLENVQVASHLALKRALGLRRGLEILGAERGAERRLAGRAEEVLGLCNLGQAARQLAGNLSYGEEKMLGLAMALMCDPELLLLDEPASGLGRDEIRNLENVLEKVHAAGTTLCLVDHKIGFLRGFADRVIALNYGQKIAEGTPERVLAEPAVVEAYLGRPRA